MIRSIKSISFIIAILFTATAYAQDNKNQTLNRRQECIVNIASLSAISDLEKLKPALNNALDAGLSVNEIKEVLIHLYAYCGFPRSLRGIQTFMSVLDERKGKGITDHAGRKASPITDKRSKFERGKENLAKLSGISQSGPPTGYAAFAPEIEIFLKEHLFADIFDRDVLTYAERELVTVSVNASIGRVEPMLQSHMAISLTNGITPGQLNQLVNLVQINVGNNEAEAARAVLVNVLKSKTLDTTVVAATTMPQKKAIVIQDQGSFAIGGSVITNAGTFDPIKRTPEGQTFHGDHGYVFYQVPANAKKLPLIFWHGIGQFSKTWETTPDGREGFQNIFLRRDFSVYLIDQPRRGRASRSTDSARILPTPDEQMWFGTFRVGVWPDYFPGVQFAKDTETLNQYFRQMAPNMGSFDPDVISGATSKLFDKIGQGILVTHSHSGGFGWLTAIKNSNVKAIVSYEPGSGFIFPEGEVPAPIASSAGPLTAIGRPIDDFMKLTKIPIVIYYGDFIPAKPDPNPGIDGWRARLEMARLWRDAVNRHGGDVQVVHLPEVGIKGNTHFPFSDLNNIVVADQMSKWLKEKKLDN